MKNSRKNIYKISMLAFFFLLIASGFSSKSIFDFGKFNKSSVFNKTPESGFIEKENDNIPDGQLFVQLPSSGFINTVFTVAVSGDSSTFLGNGIVTIAATPSGHMGGTFSVNAVNGIATFNDIYFDAAGTYFIDASAGALTGQGQIVIYPTLDPSKLVITNMHFCDSTGIMVNSLFSVTVQAQDDNNFPANVLSDINVSLTLNQGSGLSGNMSGTIPLGTNTITISGVKITQTQTVAQVKASCGGTLTPGLSSAFSVIAGPDHIGFVNLPSTGFVNFPLQTFQVAYYNSDNTPANCYDGIITLSQFTPQSPIFLSGTTSVTSNNGRATFSSVYFTSEGTYTIKATSSGLPEFNVISGSILISQGDPEITSTILPLNMQGNSTNEGHTPYVFLAKISFLTSNTPYKYYNRVVHTVNTEPGEGWGNVIFANPSGNFTRTTNPNFNTAGDYGEFTTDAYGSYTGWFISEATDDAVFTTPGDSVKMRISIKDPNTGPFMLTTTGNVRIRDYNLSLEVSKRCNFLDQTTTGTGTPLLPKNFLLFYTQVDSSNLRPVSGTLIESDGLTLTYPPYNYTYSVSIDGFNQRWGTIIPCGNIYGITKIEERSLTGNKIGNSVTSLPGSIRSVAYSSTGVWVPGVDTKNPPGGNTVLSIQPMFINVGITQIGNQVPSEYKLSQNYPNPFNPVTKIKFEIPKSSFVNLAVYDILGREVAKLVNDKLNAGTYLVDWNASQYPSGVYFYRLTTESFSEIKKMVLIK